MDRKLAIAVMRGPIAPLMLMQVDITQKVTGDLVTKSVSISDTYYVYNKTVIV